MKRKNIFISLISILILSFFMGWGNGFESSKPAVPQETTRETENNMVSVETAVGMPFAETIAGSGIAKSQKITYFSNGNFHTIKKIVGLRTPSVKKGEPLFSWDATELELRYEKIQSELELKKEILSRNTELDVHNAISKDELNKIQIEVASATGELKEIRHKLKIAKQLAPFDAYVIHSGVINGSNIKNGDEVLTIQKKNEIIIDVNINLRELNLLHQQNLQNKNAVVKLSGGKKISGKVIYFVKSVDQYAASMKVSIKITENLDLITPGEVCDVVIYTGHFNRYFYVPEEAIQGEEYNYHLYTVRQGIAHDTPIKKIKTKKNNTVVVDGLKENDLVVVSGAHKLTNLTQVQINSDGEIAND